MLGVVLANAWVYLIENDVLCLLHVGFERSVDFGWVLHLHAVWERVHASAWHLVVGHLETLSVNAEWMLHSSLPRLLLGFHDVLLRTWRLSHLEQILANRSFEYRCALLAFQRLELVQHVLGQVLAWAQE